MPKLTVSHPRLLAAFKIDFVPENSSEAFSLLLLLCKVPRRNVTDISLRCHVPFASRGRSPQLPEKTMHLCGRCAAILADAQDGVVPNSYIALRGQV